jgi:hypothetical protein
MGDRSKMMALFGIGFGLLLVAGGAMVADLGNMVYPTATTPEQDANNANLQQVWGPLITHAGMFFFVGGLFIGAFFWETADPFVRLFMLILGFVALLLVLASTTTIF